MNSSKQKFGQLDGKEIDLYILENDNGMKAKISNYGGTLTSLTVPDKNGNAADVCCGFDTLDGYFSDAYKANSPYFGCIVGRYAGRIKDGRFTVDGVDYQVATNDGPNHLHGGIVGFDKVIWQGELVSEVGRVGVRLSRISPDGEEGYPGSVNVIVTYWLTNDNEIVIDYEAKTDKATPLSLTNHAYFNLGGFKDKILNHLAQINAEKFLKPDETNVPVGEEQLVEGTVWDYRTPKPIAAVFSEQPMGFEHYYALNGPLGELKSAATVRDETSGRTLEVLTTEPGVLFYSGFYTSDELKREDGTPFGQFRAFCCETSRYPNGPNMADAPGSVTRPGENYHSKTIYKFRW